MTRGAPPSGERRRGVFRGWRARVVLGLTLVAVYALFGFVVVPWVARAQIVKQARTLLHREATVARVRFNPFTLKATVEGLELRDRDGAALFKLGRLVANVQLSGIFHRAWQLRELTIERPEATARILADGRPSIVDLLESDAPPTQPKKPFELRLRIGRLEVKGGRVDFVDESRTPRFAETLAPLDLSVHELTTIPQESGDHAVTIGIGEKTRVRWSGQQSVRPVHLEGRIELTDVLLPKFWDYAAREQPVALRNGSADVACSYDLSYAADRGLVLAVRDGSVTLRDIALRAPGGEEDWLTVPAVQVQPIQLQWPESQVDIGEIRFEEPHANGRLDASGRLNWEPAISAYGKPEPAKGPGSEAKPWTVRVGTVEIVKGSVKLEDRSLDPSVTVGLDEVALRLQHLSTELSKPVSATASVRINGSGVATLGGSVTPSPLAADLDVALSALDLVPFWPYARQSTAELRAGSASLKGKVHVSDGVPKVRFEGEGGLDGFDLADQTASRVIACKKAHARGVRLTVAPERLRIAELALDHGFIKTLIDREGKLNLTKLAGGAEPAAGAAPGAPGAAKDGAPFPVDITTISIRDAMIEYGDESLILPFGTDIRAANGSIKDLSTTSAAPARLALEGRVADTGYVKVGGALRIADPFASTDVTVTFRDVSMPKLTPYVAQFAGYAVKDGNLDLDIHYRIVDRRLVGDHRVVAKDLTLGEKVEGGGGPSLPLRLAIALLKDKDGKIDLQVPVEGSVDSPEFAYRKVFWQAIRKVLANVALAPFRAIGKLFGRDDEDLDLVGFASGRSDLLPPEQETLTKLAAELVKRPGVSIEVEGRFDPVADVAALRQARLEARIEAKRSGDVGLEAILEALYSERFSPERLEAERAKFTPSGAPPAEPPPKKKRKQESAPAPQAGAPGSFDAAGFYDALRAQLLEAEAVDATELAELARARAAAIAGALTAQGGLEASRVTTKDTAPVSRKKQGSDLVASQMTMSASD